VLLCDFNNDGFLDIYTANRRAAESAFPRAYDNRLYLNRGDGTFVERAAQLGVGVTYTPHSNGVTHVAVCFDYDADGDQDLLVAEDLAPVRLFENHLERGTLSFQDVTSAAGLNHAGHWMGLALADTDLDGDLDVFVTNWGTSPLYMAPPDKRLHALYRNNGDGSFSDVAQAAGLAQGEFGWGAAFLDWDNDGDSDLYYAGNFYANLGNLFVGDNPGHLLLNAGDGTFREATAQYDVFNQDNNGRNREARAVAVGDLNGDGYFDLVVGNAARWDVNQARAIPGRPAVFINPGGPHHWLKLRLQGTKSNRSGVGARVGVEACARRQVKTVQSGSSFLAQNSLVLGFGLGACARVGRIDVRWPSGVEQTLSAVNPDQTIHITEPAPFSSVEFKAR